MQEPTSTITPIIPSQDLECWFAMRVTYRREITVCDYLNEQGIRTFIPMKYTLKIKGKKHHRELVPAINSLIFVYTQQSTIQSIKKNIPHLQYITNKNHKKIIVPNIQMQQFIAACGTQNDSLLFLDPSEINFTKGTHVRVIGGDFEGQEGIFIKIKGKRDRRVVIAIEGVIAVVLATIHPSLIKKIDA